MGCESADDLRSVLTGADCDLVLIAAPGAFEDDPSIAAADGLAPNAWWADYAR